MALTLTLTPKQARVAIERAINVHTLNTTNNVVEQLVDSVVHELEAEEEFLRRRSTDGVALQGACSHGFYITTRCHVCNPEGGLG